MSSFKERVINSALLKSDIYEEVEADSSAIWQAMSVVVLSSIAAGIGSIYYFGLGGLITGSISALLGWVIWAGIIYFIGAKFIPEPQTEADLGQLLTHYRIRQFTRFDQDNWYHSRTGSYHSDYCFNLDADNNCNCCSPGSGL